MYNRNIFEEHLVVQGKRLREEREKKWRSRRKCCEETGLKNGTLISWEMGRYPISSKGLNTLAEHGVDSSYILTGARLGAARVSEIDTGMPWKVDQAVGRVIACIAMDGDVKEIFGAVSKLTGYSVEDVEQFITRQKQMPADFGAKLVAKYLIEPDWLMPEGGAKEHEQPQLTGAQERMIRLCDDWIAYYQKKKQEIIDTPKIAEQFEEFERMRNAPSKSRRA